MNEATGTLQTPNDDDDDDELLKHVVSLLPDTVVSSSLKWSGHQGTLRAYYVDWNMFLLYDYKRAQEEWYGSRAVTLNSGIKNKTWTENENMALAHFVFENLVLAHKYLSQT